MDLKSPNRDLTSLDAYWASFQILGFFNVTPKCRRLVNVTATNKSTEICGGICNKQNFKKGEVFKIFGLVTLKMN